MRFSHKRISLSLRKFALRQIWKIIQFVFIAAIAIGFLIGQGLNNQVQIQANTDAINEAKTYAILSEKRLSDIATRLEKDNNTEAARLIRDAVKDLENLRMKANLENEK